MSKKQQSKFAKIIEEGGLIEIYTFLWCLNAK